MPSDACLYWTLCAVILFAPLLWSWTLCLAAPPHVAERHCQAVSTPLSTCAHLLLQVTQLVTAFWHGAYPGYLLFFVGTVFYLQSARTIYRAEKQVLPKWLVNSYPWWLIKVRALCACLCVCAGMSVCLCLRVYTM